MRKEIFLTVFLSLTLIMGILSAGCTGTTSTSTPPTPTTLAPTVPPATTPPATMATGEPATPLVTHPPRTPVETPGPVGVLPDMYSLDLQVQNNGEAIDPKIIITCRGGNGMNFDSMVDVQLTRSDGIVETAQMPPPYFVGKSVSLAATTRNNDRVEIWVTAPQVGKVKTYDQIVPFRNYN